MKMLQPLQAAEMFQALVGDAREIDLERLQLVQAAEVCQPVVGDPGVAEDQGFDGRKLFE